MALPCGKCREVGGDSYQRNEAHQAGTGGAELRIAEGRWFSAKVVGVLAAAGSAKVGASSAAAVPWGAGIKPILAKLFSKV